MGNGWDYIFSILTQKVPDQKNITPSSVLESVAVASPSPAAHQHHHVTGTGDGFSEVSLGSSVPGPATAHYAATAQVQPLVSVPMATSSSVLLGTLQTGPAPLQMQTPLLPSSTTTPSIPPISLPGGLPQMTIPNLTMPPNLAMPPNFKMPPLNLPPLTQVGQTPLLPSSYPMPTLANPTMSNVPGSTITAPISGQMPLPSWESLNAALPKVTPIAPQPTVPETQAPIEANQQNGEA